MNTYFRRLVLNRTKFSTDVLGLYFQRLIQSTATSLLGIFLPIFLYEVFDFSLQSLMLYYVFSFTGYILLVQPGAKMMCRFGLKTAMILSTPFNILFYLTLYLVDDSPWSLLLLGLFTLNIYRMLYWVPYHTEFAKFTDRFNRGKQISLLESLGALVGIMTPIISGFVIAQFGYQSLFVTVMLLLAVSIYPLIATRQVRETFSYGYFETFKILFTKKRRLLMAYGAEGFEAAIGLVIWPIFMYKIFAGDYFEIGAVSTLVILVTVVIRIFMGRYTDKLSKRKLLRLGTVIYSIGWIFKVFVQTGYDIFLASTYHNLAKAVMRTPFDALSYEQMADAGHYVDEMSVFREISLNLGRVVMFALLFILVGVISLNAIFWIAAVSALFINLL